MRGTYKGELGWKDTEKAPTNKMIYVIIAISNKVTEEKLVRVKKRSIRKVSERKLPTNFEEAVVLENCDIERDMERLAQKIAACHGFGKKSFSPIARIFESKLAEAFDEQHRLGSAALYRVVEWKKREGIH